MSVKIDRTRLQQRIAKGDIVVLEALPVTHWEQEHIPGAVAFPLDDIDGLAPQVIPERSTPVAVYCSNATCSNSHTVAERLLALGYTDVSRYVEGKEDWIGAGLPVEHG
ncbi:MAG: rhodanese-like domain-containing protein [Acidimicrobiia bacterium]